MYSQSFLIDFIGPNCTIKFKLYTHTHMYIDCKLIIGDILFNYKKNWGTF